MIPKPLAEVTKQDLEALATSQVHEGRTIEYKRDVKLTSDEDKRETARDVSSFANAAGGDLIFGVVEAKDGEGKGLGYPEKIIGVPDNFDDMKLRFESVVRDTLDPRVPGIAIHKVEGFDRGPVIVVRIPKSWTAPHMVTFRNQTHFYSRNNSGKQPLDVREIRASFLAGTELAARVRGFRDARLGTILSGETPVPTGTGPKLVLHVIALHAFGDEPVDVQKLNPNNDLLRPLEMGSGWNTRFNLDGLVAYTGNAGPHYSYTQAFRLGALEGFTMVGTTTAPDGSHRRMYPASVETDVMKGVQHYVMKLRTVGLDGPSSVLVALLGVKGLRASYGAYELPWDKDNLIDRDLLILPDILIEPERDDLATLMRPAFDALWQAGGYERSFGYDAAGNWDPKAHR